MTDEVNPLGVDPATAGRSIHEVAGVPEPAPFLLFGFADMTVEERARAQARRAAVESARQAAYARVLLWHDQLLKRWSVGPLGKGVLELHRPELVAGEPDAVCTGCDPGSPESYHPEWPCRTYVQVGRYVGGRFDEQDRPVFE